MFTKFSAVLSHAVIIILSTASSLAAPLPPGTVLTLEPAPFGNTTIDGCIDGSCLGAEASDGLFLWFSIESGTDGGIILGKDQASGGHESISTPNGSGELTAEFNFKGITASISTQPTQSSVGYVVTSNAAANIFDDASCAGAACIGKTELNTWHWSFNGAVVPLGSANGCLSTRCPPDQQAGIFVRRWEVFPDGRYILDFANNVPDGHPSGFGGVFMPTHLEGQIILPPPAPAVSGFWPTAGEPGDFVFVFGENYQVPNSEVLVNGVQPLMQHLVNDTLALFAVPFGDVVGPVTVRTNTGMAFSNTAFGSVTTGLAVNGIWPASGPVGTHVFVFGNGFLPNGGTTVAVSGISTHFIHIIDATTLIVRIPDGATDGPISVTTNSVTVDSTVFSVTP